MKIADAKAIPLQNLVEYLGGRFSHQDRKGDLWYFSPFRPEERTASFKINVKLNTWHDFGMANTIGHNNQGSGGDTVDLWCDYHLIDRRFGVPEALMGLSKLGHSAIGVERLKQQQSKENPPVQDQEPRYKILRLSERFTHFGLKDELQRRRISISLAEMYLKQGHILDTINGKKYYGFLFENDKGGYEVSIPNPKRGESFKTCIGPKATTRILTSNETTNSADVFEGFWDFLSLLELKGRMLPVHQTYILNSTSLVGEACEKIFAFEDQVGYVFLFMDNDEAGYKATHAIAANLEPNFKVGSWAQFYTGFKDLNEFWMSEIVTKQFKPIFKN